MDFNDTLEEAKFRTEVRAWLEADARVRVYRLRRERFTELRGWLDEVEAFWGDQLAAFKAHAEKTRGKRT